jgi:hypothetical protein
MVVNPSATVTPWRIISEVRTGNTFDTFIDGGSLTMSATFNGGVIAGSAPLTIGVNATTPTPTDPMRSPIAEILVVNNSAVTRDVVEGYLAHKWGLTASLPANHPYKNIAP